MFARTLTVAFGALLLAGCQTLDGYLPSFGSDPESVSKTSESDAASGLTTQQDDALVDEQTASVFSSPIDDNPQQFMGLGDQAVMATLGDPDLTRRDGPAEIRQFRGQDCVLDLFMYPAAGDLAVRHVELRGPTLTPADRRACMVDMIRDRALTG